MTAKLIATVAFVTAIGASGTAAVAADGHCVVLHDVAKGTTWRSDDTACGVRLSPASTFKIPHALIALETGAIKQDTIEKWDGRRYPGRTVWEKDHNLRSAISNSVLWFFQRTSVRIGAVAMKGWLEKFSYGNTDTSGDPTMYWVNGRLQISPNEQVEFLKRFFANDLPVRAEYTTHVRGAMVQEPGTVRNATGLHKVTAPWAQGIQLLTKTGATTADGAGVSWLVGAIDNNGRRHVFASAVWRAGGVDPLEATKQAVTTFGDRGLLK